MSGTEEALLPLEEADREGIGGKARRLAMLSRLDPSLFSIPRGLVATPAFDPARDAGALRARAIELGGGSFAVRSSALAEDAHDRSLAGRFRTELEIGIDELPAAVDRVRASFGAHAPTGSVLIQPMIRADFAGVLFTESPANRALASCEFARERGDQVVSGRVQPARVDYGRWSGDLYADPAALAGLREMLAHLFLVGMLVESRLGSPQDIEWAYEARRRKLTLLQCRAITAFTQSEELAREQARAAAMLAQQRSRARRPVLKSAAVREVVLEPSRMTRSLIERLYATDGSLGAALRMLGFPVRATEEPYVVSVFGKLYARADVERRIFGFRPASWWAGRRWRKRMRADRAGVLRWLREEIERTSMPAPPPAPVASHEEAALLVSASARAFVDDVYRVAHAATLLAQIAREAQVAGAMTTELMRDLSRLHHNRALEPFLARWGHRSANDYELSEPRFAEEPERARAYARRFQDLPWADTAAPLESFVALKELAKDHAVRLLGSVRDRLLELERALGLEPGAVFFLELSDVDGLASGAMDGAEAARRIEARRLAESTWAGIALEDELTLERVETLHTRSAPTAALRGKMVGAARGFEGRARVVARVADAQLDAGEVLVVHLLEPEIVGLFAKSSGCVADLGGALSHAAIVARELRYPVLVLPGSTATLREGDLVRVDERGFVEIVPAR